MVTIPRHEYPTRNLADLLEHAEPKLRTSIDGLGRTSEEFSFALPAAVTVLDLRCAGDPTAAQLETWEACVTAMQIGSAFFTSALATGDTVDCVIAHEKRTVRTGAHRWAHPSDWLTAFWLSCICREKRRLDELCRVPVSFLRRPGAVFDSYIYAWVEALQAYWLKQPEFGAKLVAAVEGTAPEAIQHTGAGGVLRLMYPPMNLMTQLARGDDDRFNNELAKALQWHKEYWSSEEDFYKPEGLVSLSLTAVACLARDAGFDITVDSEYIPRYLLEGEWVGEFRTV
ncbi:immunity 49 family protein [Nocardia sp. NPDC048505]|uniref:immunity 49 family protein n=1 Tax=unclassified Nocardia TaxID=2637762 RepID=UPI0033FC0029